MASAPPTQWVDVSVIGAAFCGVAGAIILTAKAPARTSATKVKITFFCRRPAASCEPDAILLIEV
jgi:hypothetical protein